MVRKIMNDELQRVKPQDAHLISRLPAVLVLDNVRSAANVGSIFRSADSFAIAGICLCGYTARPPHAEIRKTALGAEETIPWKYFERTENAIELLSNQNFEIACLEQTNQSVLIERYAPSHNFTGVAIILGNEVDGVNENLLPLCDSFIEIEQYGSKHSLNVAVAAGIALFELNKKAPRLTPDAFSKLF